MSGFLYAYSRLILVGNVRPMAVAAPPQVQNFDEALRKLLGQR